MCFERVRPVPDDPTPVRPPPQDDAEPGLDRGGREISPEQLARLQAQNAPRAYSSADTPAPTSADISQATAASAAPQSLGGFVARFAVPLGRRGYTHSLRPESGRMVR